MKQFVRSVKNNVMLYAEPERLVRDATNSDPWGASSTLMYQIAEITHDRESYKVAMRMLWKRLTDVTYPRHVLKALLLVEFLLRNGSARFVSDMRERKRRFKTLKKFTEYSKDGEEIGNNIRVKADMIVTLLEDEQHLREEREVASRMRAKLASGSSASNHQEVGRKPHRRSNSQARNNSHGASIGLGSSDFNSFGVEKHHDDKQTISASSQKREPKRSPSLSSQEFFEADQVSLGLSDGPNGPIRHHKKKKKKKKKKQARHDSIQEIDEDNVFDKPSRGKGKANLKGHEDLPAPPSDVESEDEPVSQRKTRHDRSHNEKKPSKKSFKRKHGTEKRSKHRKQDIAPPSGSELDDDDEFSAAQQEQSTVSDFFGGSDAFNSGEMFSATSSTSRQTSFDPFGGAAEPEQNASPIDMFANMSIQQSNQASASNDTWIDEQTTAQPDAFAGSSQPPTQTQPQSQDFWGNTAEAISAQPVFDRPRSINAMRSGSQIGMPMQQFTQTPDNSLWSSSSLPAKSVDAGSPSTKPSSPVDLWDLEKSLTNLDSITGVKAGREASGSGAASSPAPEPGDDPFTSIVKAANTVHPARFGLGGPPSPPWQGAAAPHHSYPAHTPPQHQQMYPLQPQLHQSQHQQMYHHQHQQQQQQMYHHHHHHQQQQQQQQMFAQQMRSHPQQQQPRMW